jgi:hypothetical protein
MWDLLDFCVLAYFLVLSVSGICCHIVLISGLVSGSLVILFYFDKSNRILCHPIYCFQMQRAKRRAPYR